MTNSTRYLIQFVGFNTGLQETEFIHRWMPFASNFKNRGIISIDLYRVEDHSDLAYISRNICDEKTYFQNFPTGVAGSGGGGGISVTQFGAYRILPDQLERKSTMRLLFMNDLIKLNAGDAEALPGASSQGPFKAVQFLDEDAPTDIPTQSLEIKCKHLQQM